MKGVATIILPINKVHKGSDLVSYTAHQRGQNQKIDLHATCPIEPLTNCWICTTEERTWLQG